MTSHWWVVSPEIVEIEPVLDDGSGPLIYYNDAVSVAASTRREAIRLGVKAMQFWPKYARRDDRNPFAGVQANEALCSHGFCLCDVDGCTVGHEGNGHGDYCEKCDAEHQHREGNYE